MSEERITKLFEFKLEDGNEDEPTGEFEAVFSTFDIVDRDGDVIKRSALKSGTPVKIASYGHKWNELPAGRGTIQVREKDAVIDGQFFLDTEAGLETYKTVKNMGELQEWSWGFVVKDGGSHMAEKDGKRVRIIEDVEVFEVSPVLVGANPVTSTIDIKSKDDDDTKSDDDSVEEKNVEGVEEKANSPEQIEPLLETLRALLIEELEEGASTYQINYLIRAMSSLEWYQNDLTWRERESKDGPMADEYKEAIRKLLKSYANTDVIDAGFALVDDRGDSERSDESYVDQARGLLASFEAFNVRSKSLADLRAKQNRKLADAHLERWEEVLDEFEAAASDLKALLEEQTKLRADDSEDTNTQSDGDDTKQVDMRRKRVDIELRAAQARARLLETGD